MRVDGAMAMAPMAPKFLGLPQSGWCVGSPGERAEDSNFYQEYALSKNTAIIYSIILYLKQRADLMSFTFYHFSRQCN